MALQLVFPDKVKHLKTTHEMDVWFSDAQKDVGAITHPHKVEFTFYAKGSRKEIRVLDQFGDPAQLTIPMLEELIELAKTLPPPPQDFADGDVRKPAMIDLGPGTLVGEK